MKGIGKNKRARVYETSCFHFSLTQNFLKQPIKLYNIMEFSVARKAKV